MLPSASSPARALFSTRTALFLGFGGVLLLLVVSGLDAVQVLTEVRSRNEQIRRNFLTRARQLDHIRSELYLSGTYVRDYILEPDARAAARNLDSLGAIRRRIADELQSYQQMIRPEQRQPFAVLQAELEAYWRSVDPVFHWDTAQRRAAGYEFLRDKVFPRRASMLSIADRIAGVNEQELTAGDRQLSEMFVSLRNRLVVVFSIAVLVGLLQAAFSMRRILRLERATERHLEAATVAREQSRELSARLVAAQESERKSISRELHDAVGQSLSAVLFEVRNLNATLPDDPPSLKQHTATIRRLVESTVAMVRHMALLLRPSMLDDLGLIPALEWQARDVSKRTGLVVDVTADELPDDLPDEHKTCIYRIVQEALHNVVKHASATHVKVSVEERPGVIRLTVGDNGRGFATGETKGLGLIGIGERAENLRGTFRVESKEGSGTLLEVILPCP